MCRLAVIALLLAACGPTLTPVDPPAQPGGTMAVQFTRGFAPGHWEPGPHGYRLGVSCTELEIALEPPVIRFDAEPSQAVLDEPVWLRFDGPSPTSLSPSDHSAIHPDQATVAVMTLVGLTVAEAELAVTDCAATVVYDGNDAERLDPGEPFIP